MVFTLSTIFSFQVIGTMLATPLRIVLIGLIFIIALVIGLLLRRRLVDRLKKNTELDAWLVQTLGVLVVLIPYVLIEAAAYSGTAAGAALLPFAMVLALVSPLLGGLSGRIGARAPLSVGSLMVAAGFLLILRIGPDGKYWTSVLPAILLIALGMAGAVAPSQMLFWRRSMFATPHQHLDSIALWRGREGWSLRRCLVACLGRPGLL